MGDAVAMRRGEGVADLDCVLKPLIKRRCASLQTVGERLPFEELHHQEIGAILVADVVQRADVRMIQRRDSACFAIEPFTELRIAGELRRQDFDGDVASQPRIARAIDFAHPARSKRGHDLVRAEPSSSRKRHAERRCSCESGSL